MHSPAPLSTAPPAGSGRVVGVLGEHQRGDAGAGDATAARRGGRSRARGRHPRRRAPSWSGRSAACRSRSPGHARAACAHPAATPARTRWDADAVRSPGGLVPDDPATRPEARGLGRRRRRPGTEVPARVDAILGALDGAPAGRGDAARRRSPRARPRPSELLDFLAGRVPRWAAGAVRRAGRPGPGRAVLLPDAGAARRAWRRRPPRRCTRRPGGSATTR